MSYQVLARKWRPKTFAELVGQEHVLRALINALDSNRIHHAFLFSGTRGVGKTTIARLFAKSLNCEKGVSSTPCGQCSTCIEIDNGHYVDLIEVDAASRTKVEETRDLLDNVQYAPTRGLYKVYLIDEVHMFSNHSFNALLKTLEEPPPHVKFLLATTDPQKLPITILSRCLQFNLRRIPSESIEDYLKLILDKESVKFESNAVHNIAKVADGSMRDALSILDQGISFGNGELVESDINLMLGSIEQTHVFYILEALSKNDAVSIVACIKQQYEQAVDFTNFLSEILTCLHNIALIQRIPEAFDEKMGDKERLTDLVNSISAEDIQLYYQIALVGQRDLLLAPNSKVGFEMVLLRMLAFQPESMKKKHNKIEKKIIQQPNIDLQDNVVETISNRIIEKTVNNSLEATSKITPSNNDVVLNQYNNVKIESEAKNEKFPWKKLVSLLNVTGLDKQLLMNCILINNENNFYKLALSPNNSSLLTKERHIKIESLMSDVIGDVVKLDISIEQNSGESLTDLNKKELEINQNKATESIRNDKNVQDIIDTFSASINTKSIKPI